MVFVVTHMDLTFRRFEQDGYIYQQIVDQGCSGDGSAIVQETRTKSGIDVEEFRREMVALFSELDTEESGIALAVLDGIDGIDVEGAKFSDPCD